MTPNKFIVAIFFSLPLLACVVNAGPAVFDITALGAKSGGDISAALLSAWKKAVVSPVPAKIVIPRGTWLLNQAKLVGPNKSPIELNVQGTLKAPLGALPIKEAEWVTINYVTNFEISGGGVFDGQGHQVWKRNDCNKNSKCAKMPLNLSFNFIKNAFIHDVTTKDSKNFHVNCISSTNVTFQRFTVSAPGEAPNTDGIHIALSSHVNVLDSTIKTGDDCISIGDGSTDFHITNVVCGPGHGISIGSLGKNPAEKDVSGIYVKHCTFKGTQNGIRIKTWPSAPAKIKVSDLHFEDLIMENVNQPIIIDQEYCPWNLCSLSKPSLIQLSNISVKNVRGTSSSQDAVTMVCSGAKPCQNVVLSDIDLKYTGKLGPTKTKCRNVRPSVSGKQNPRICPILPAAK